MHKSTSFRVSAVMTLALCLAVLLAGLGQTATASAAMRVQPRFTTGYPNSIAATGDSISQAFNSAGFADQPAYSWSTGNNAAISSHYNRILSANPAINGKNFNDAVSGTKMNSLQGQLANAVGQQADYVTILMGANDICTAATITDITPVDTFTNQFRAALTTFSQGAPDSRVFVSSIPNLINLWEILHTNTTAQAIWNQFNICPPVLPTNTSSDSTRQTVAQTLTQYNNALQNVCAEFIHCRFDGFNTFNTAFTPADVSQIDYFHPSVQGQQTLAAGTWAKTFQFTDTVAPVSQAVYTNDFNAGNLSVTLTATDNIGLSGLEYKLNGGNWTRYTTPVVLTSTAISLTYRAVDVNGNNEVAHTVWIVGSTGGPSSSGQTFAQALASARSGDLVAFAVNNATVAVSTTPLTVGAGVSILGGTCSSRVTLFYNGANLGVLSLSGADRLTALNLLNLQLGTTKTGGGNQLSCVKVTVGNG